MLKANMQITEAKGKMKGKNVNAYWIAEAAYRIN